MPSFLISRRYVTTIGATTFCLQLAAWAAPADAFGATVIGLKRGTDAPSLEYIASQDSAAVQARMRRCMRSWGPGTQMSKREWKSTCRRVIIQQPGFFTRNPL
jgi:hypothetical protein